MSMSSSEIRVSVVIVNYNGRHHLEYCLPALAETRGVDFETIVVDNGSDDGSAEFVAEKHPEVKIVALGENTGFGRANQSGVDTASGELIAFLNNDTIVDSDWLLELLACLRREERVGAACSLLRFADHPDIVNGCGGGMTWLGFGHCRGFGVPLDLYGPCADPDRADECLYPTAAAMLISKRVFADVGGFDRKFFMYHEDVDLGWRLWILGYRVLVCKRSVVYHREGGTTKTERDAHWSESLGARHDIRSIIKNYEPKNVLAALSVVSAAWICNRRVGMTFRSWVRNILWLPDTLRERRWIQKARRRSDRELFGTGPIERWRHFPPRPHEFPLKGRVWGKDKWFESPLLLPGCDSSFGRLGFGWFPPQEQSGRVCRASWAVASAYLRVQPNLKGRLILDMHYSGRQSAQVEIFCNGSRKQVDLSPDIWRSLAIDTESDRDGLLAVRIANAADRAYGMGDMRGCDIARIEFESEGIDTTKYSSVDIIVPTYNRCDTLMQTLAALERQTRLPERVVVVDDGSADSTADMLASYRESGGLPFELLLRHQSNSGPAAARNRALELASSDLLIFIGDDTIPAEDFVERHLEKQGMLGAFAAVVGYTDWHSECGNNTPFLGYINRSGDQFGYGLMDDGADVPFTCLYTSNLSIPRSAVKDEGFDEWFRFAGWEDVELGYRLSLRGLRIVYCRAAETSHMHSMSLADFLRRQFWMGRVYAALIDRHLHFREHFKIRPCALSKFFHCSRPILALLAGLAQFFDKRRLPLPRFAYRILLIWSFSAGMESPVDYGDDPR